MRLAPWARRHRGGKIEASAPGGTRPPGLTEVGAGAPGYLQKQVQCRQKSTSRRLVRWKCGRSNIAPTPTYTIARFGRQCGADNLTAARVVLDDNNDRPYWYAPPYLGANHPKGKTRG